MGALNYVCAVCGRDTEDAWGLYGNRVWGGRLLVCRVCGGTTEIRLKIRGAKDE